MSPAQPMNLVVYLARAGVGSRRWCDELIREGVVTVNDEVVTFPRQKVTPEDVVAVRGEPVSARELRYFLINKPRGVASTRSDPHADRVIVDMVPNGRALFPVGRLDVDTTGLIILTNDGVLANRLMHPRYGVPKTSRTSRVCAARSAGARSGTLRQGVDLEDGPTSPADVKLKKQSAKTALVEITIHEGRKRQVRRMFLSVGLPVEEPSRRRYGPLTDKGLEPGGFRELSGDEVEALRRAGEEVAGEVAKEVEGSPLMLAAEVDAVAAPLSPEAVLLADAATAAEQGEPQPFDAGPAPSDEGVESAARSGGSGLDAPRPSGSRTRHGPTTTPDMYTLAVVVHVRRAASAPRSLGVTP